MFITRRTIQSAIAVFIAVISVTSLCLALVVFPRSAVATESMVDINHANAEQLADRLFGIGPAKARAIVAYRDLHGPFLTVEELVKVKGIGPRTLEKIRAHLIVNGEGRLTHQHDAIAAIASGGERSKGQSERATRRAVRSVIEAARNNNAVQEP